MPMSTTRRTSSTAHEHVYDVPNQCSTPALLDDAFMHRLLGLSGVGEADSDPDALGIDPDRCARNAPARPWPHERGPSTLPASTAVLSVQRDRHRLMLLRSRLDSLISRPFQNAEPMNSQVIGASVS